MSSPLSLQTPEADRNLLQDTIASDYPGSISQHDAVTPSYQHEFSPRNEIIRVILKLWSTDLRFLTYNVQTRPIAQLDRSNGSTRGQADSLSSVLLAITGLLDATNALSVRSPVAETILALQRATRRLWESLETRLLLNLRTSLPSHHP